MKRISLAALLLTLAACAAGPRPAQDPEGKREVHIGEILGVDRDAATVTLRIARRDSNETYVFQVTDETVIEDARGERITLAGVRAGQRVRIKSQRGGNLRRALEIEVKRGEVLGPERP